ncbi:hypothetical protein HMPREF9629_01018 [Peptoanaerobacter stomatis]|uniref:Copper amine oxidase-like N-terminal domain-containing protein n=1 Tax=Peptoanaerobacter stomatis TaxID=796937 RepID=G9X3R1_9FIRM|nr:hypothetical protein [Peptoanaerobacter stomatis]EHL10026.1 hypothetical protein HMPREF9629_01018 [Peptoanaerobacter stomatis]
MNFKKIVSSVLSGMMIFTSLAFYSSANADSASDEYFENLKRVSNWEKMETQTNIKTGFDANLDKDEKVSFGYDIELNSKFDRSKMSGDLNVKFTPKNDKTPVIPEFKLYFDDKDLYINKEFVSMVGGYIGIDKKFDRDFVKIELNEKDSKKLGLNSKYMKNYYENAPQLTEKMINFIKSIDLGIDLGLTKKSDNNYILTWDSDKMVDITNAYFKYIFSNFDSFAKFYNDVLGIDVYEVYKESGVEVSKEELENNMKEALEMWKKQVEPMMPVIKEVIKGSEFSMEETFGDDNYSAKISLNINIDVNKVDKLFNSTLNSTENDNVNVGVIGKRDEKNSEQNIKFLLQSDQMSKSSPDLEMKAPNSYDTFNYSEFMTEKQKQIEEELKKYEEEQKNAKQKGDDKYEISISPSKKILVKNEYGEKSETKIDCKVQNGVLYVKTSDLEEYILHDVLDEKDEYLPFKKIMEEREFDVVWNAKEHIITATMK